MAITFIAERHGKCLPFVTMADEPGVSRLDNTRRCYQAKRILPDGRLSSIGFVVYIDQVFVHTIQPATDKEINAMVSSTLSTVQNCIQQAHRNVSDKNYNYEGCEA